MSRITLLFGANSSGKTSIIQALLMLKQTITEATDPRTVLLPNGSLISLGNFREFVHKHDIEREIQIGLESNFRNKMYYTFQLRNDILEMSNFEGIAEKWLEKNSRINNWRTIRFQGENKGSNQYLVNLINYAKIFDEYFKKKERKTDLIKELKKRKDYSQRTIELLEGETRILEERDQKEKNEEEKKAYYRNMMNILFENIFKSLQEGSETDPSEEFRQIFSRLPPQEFELTSKLLKQLSGDQLLKIFDDLIENVKNNNISSLLDFKEEISVQNPLLLRSSSVLESSQQTRLDEDTKSSAQIMKLAFTNIFRDYCAIPSLRRIYEYSNREINHQISRLIFLGPLRREPERYYFFSGNIPLNVGKKGDKTAEALFYSKNIQDAVNIKLNDLGIDYHINVTPVSGETKDIFSVRLLDQVLKTDVSISEVGFGVSQILPIIVQSYLSRSSIICVEQPEIHIHPALQTKLAHLFYERIEENPELQYIIETHSEHIILRYQRLIREKALTPEDISVLYLTREEEGIICKELKMDQSGDFIDPWPEGFFEEAFRERFG